MQDQLTLRGTSSTPVQAAPAPLSPTAVQALIPVRWTGSDANALRKTLRVTEGKFARSLGVSVRTVSNWAADPSMVPRNAAQDAHDELLAAASSGAVAKFAQLTERQAAAPLGPGNNGTGGQVIPLGTHPRYAADFRAVACGQVAAARAALGLTLAEFAALLRDALGWNVLPETAGRWEDSSTPPGDVVLFAQAYLAGAR
jgi:DNA-binding transcriptional regulator YiaG